MALILHGNIASKNITTNKLIPCNKFWAEVAIAWTHLNYKITVNVEKVHGLQSNFLEYYSIINAIPREWLLSDNVQIVGTTLTLIGKICTANKAGI